MTRRGVWAAVAAWLVLGCGGPDRGPSEGPAPAAPSEFEDVRMTAREPDGAVWELAARSGTAREAQGSARLRQVRGTVRKGDQTVRFVAGAARVREGTAIVLEEGVRIGMDGYEVRITGARYEKGGFIVSEDPVEARGPGLRLTGRGVRVDVDRRVALIGGPVRATVWGRPAGPAAGEAAPR